MIMLKNGNFDTEAALCPANGKKRGPFRKPKKFPCFGKGCMNQPLVYHNPSKLQSTGKLKGKFCGSYDFDADFKSGRQKKCLLLFGGMGEES